MSILYFLVLNILSLSIHTNGEEECSLTQQSCDSDRLCAASQILVELPEFLSAFGDGTLDREIIEYGCSSPGYCQWAGMDNVDCVRLQIPDKYVDGFTLLGDYCAGPVSVPITINQTVSCCRDEMDNCTAVFNGIIDPFDNTLNDAYSHTNCEDREELVPIVEEVVLCYGTQQFMKCR